MKAFKYLILGLIIGGLLGFAGGMNVGKGKPLLSNPFAEKKLSGSLKDTGAEIMRKGGEAIEDTGKAIKDKFQ